ncbi:MAG: DUF4097 family beta strand repeat-containing protein [Culicoidibacterales bacterium]
MIKIGRITLAITVILIGSVWVMNVINPELANELSIYWPIVFIIYGLELIISSFFHREKKLSIWLLIVVILLAFSASNLLDSQRFDWKFIWTIDGILENGVTEQVEISQPIGGATQTKIEVPNGRIEVLPSPDSNMHFIGNAVWQKTMPTPNVSFEREGNKWQLSDKKLISLNGKLLLPKTIENLEFMSMNGSLKIESGLSMLAIDAETTNGVFEIHSGKQITGKTINGDILVHQVEIISAKTTNGNIELNSPRLLQVDVETQQGSITINTDEIKLATIRSVNGNIQLGTTQNNYRIQAHSVNGNIAIFGQDYEKNIVLEQNQSGSSILLETTNGDIIIDKGE